MVIHYIQNEHEEWSICGHFSKRVAMSFVSGKYIWGGRTTSDKTKVTCKRCQKMNIFKEV